MRTSPTPSIPVYPFEPVAPTAPLGFSINRLAGALPYEASLLLPHRRAYYLLVLVERNQGQHWVDDVRYQHHPHTLYFSTPSQVLVKEEPTPFWGTSLTFTDEFLALSPDPALSQLPLVLNPLNQHELPLAPADYAFVHDLLTQLLAEAAQPGEWQRRLLTGHLAVLLTYLSRLYTTRFQPADSAAADRLLLRAYQARVAEHFRAHHDVAAYAAMLHLSAGHLSAVVKAQSGKPAIKHVHERLVLEAKRQLLYSASPLKEVAFDLGFAEPSYFNRFFKRETGRTPADYRAAIRKMYQ